MNLHVHLHALVLDGVFARTTAGVLRFHAAPPPSAADMADILTAIVPPVRRLLTRHGLDADDSTAADPFADATPLLAGWAALHRTPSGDVAVQLRSPWGDGTTHVAFPPSAFLARLAVLIPRPRVNLLLYHGRARAAGGVASGDRAARTGVGHRRDARRVAVGRLDVQPEPGLALGGPDATSL